MNIAPAANPHLIPPESLKVGLHRSHSAPNPSAIFFLGHLVAHIVVEEVFFLRYRYFVTLRGLLFFRIFLRTHTWSIHHDVRRASCR